MSAVPILPEGWRIQDFHLAMPEFMENPEYFYHRLVTEAPVLSMQNVWLVSSHHGCTQLLNDKRCIVTQSQMPDPGVLATVAAPPPGYEALGRMRHNMLRSNPPDHTRLRGLINKAFTPRAVEALRPRITALAHELLDQVQQRGEMDLVTDFAFHLPAIVIADLLGVPRQDRERFKEWSNSVAQSLGIDATDARRQASWRAQLALGEFFDDLLAKRREHPADDLMTALLRAEEDGEQLTHDEVVATCTLLLIAGHETTTNLIGSGILALLRNPEQMELFRRRPEIAHTAVEELLRWTSPVQRTARLPLEPIVVEQVEIPARRGVMVMLAAANRDPAVFVEPERLDLTRDPNPHIAFGKGIHFCLGAPLARLEAEIAFPILLERLPNLKLAPPGPVWNPGIILRSLHSLPVTF